MEIIEKIIKSETPPQQTNVAWLNPVTKEIKYFVDGEWSTVYGALPAILNGLADLAAQASEAASKIPIVAFTDEELAGGTDAPLKLDSARSQAVLPAIGVTKGDTFLPRITLDEPTTNWLNDWLGDVTPAAKGIDACFAQLRYGVSNDGTIQSSLGGGYIVLIYLDDNQERYAVFVEL